MKKYQIFVSSTYTDLIEERDAVCNAILRMHHFPVGMEQFNSEDTEQWNVIKNYIDSSDYYVLIIGKRYGSVIESGENAGISYTEKEFNYAVSQGIPVLTFIKSNVASYKGTDFEADAVKSQKLKNFTDRATTGRVVEWFDNRYELATKVTASLHNEMAKNNRPGWVRGTPSNLEAKVDELIQLLKKELEYDEATWHYDNEPITDYEFKSPQSPSDGKHKEIGRNGAIIGEGEYKNGKLIKGIEFDVLVHITKGKLIYKPDCPEDPYDSSADFQYRRIESYGWGLSFSAFGSSTNHVVEDGLENYYVADFEVDEKTEQMTNIRTLKKFLKEKDPKQLELIFDMIKVKNE